MKYKVNEIFQSLQGEGFNQGKNVIFIRLSGCNLSCKWCDTEHSSYTELSLPEIITEISNYNVKSVIITGGEPTLHNLTPLLKELKGLSYWIGIESNGTNSFKEIREYLDYIAISPKDFFQATKVNEVRLVNAGLSLDHLKKIERKISADKYFLSPLDNGQNMNIFDTMKLLGEINEVSTNKWHLSLQLHKLANIK